MYVHAKLNDTLGFLLWGEIQQCHHQKKHFFVQGSKAQVDSLIFCQLLQGRAGRVSPRTSCQSRHVWDICRTLERTEWRNQSKTHHPWPNEDTGQRQALGASCSLHPQLVPGGHSRATLGLSPHHTDLAKSELNILAATNQKEPSGSHCLIVLQSREAEFIV